jgi:diguanylate cyclase (GGDEF)-like protein
LIEKEQNKNNIETFLNDINKSLENLKNTTNDYAHWDASYDFMKNKNKNYIYENFREGSQTLLEINLDSIMYLNSKNKVIFSRYSNEYLNSHKNDFENFLVEKFKNETSINGIVNYNTKLIYLFKSQVKRSDKTGENVGYIFSAKIIDNKSFSQKYTIFEKVDIANYTDERVDLNIKLNFLDAKISTSTDDEYLKNNIQFFTQNGEYAISLVTNTHRDLIKNSKKTIFLFDFVICFILLFIFIFIYKNQLFIHNQNELLDKRVKNRTKRLKTIYKKLSEKNKELFQLANIDSLTKIRNRRNYFIESSNLLEKAILNNQSLDVAIIDIDDFKKINDRYGHAVGDEVLIAFCNIVNNIIDKSVIFGRLGGEEFCLTFYDKDEQEVLSICEAIRYKCSNIIFPILNYDVTFTISIGLSSINNSEDSMDKILHRADILLYEAKNSGKNRLIRRI